MNIASTDELLEIVAKMCCCKDKEKEVIYSFVDNPYGLCIDKRDIISAELEACKRLLKHPEDKADEETVNKEIAELKMALDLMHRPVRLPLVN
jgi:hypothetical protein